MAKFMYVFRGGGLVVKGLSPADLGAHLGKWTAWINELAKAGHNEVHGPPLQMAGKTVRGSDRQITDGPFAEGKDLVTGTLMVIAGSLDEATELALGCPIYEYEGSVEVRPIFEREG
jgi:hypothetical protein